jgi:hypothetical protein
LAAARYKRSAPDQRALAAELELLGDPLWESLAAMSAAAEKARLAKQDARRASWDRWVQCVQQVFNQADDWWRAALPALSNASGRRGALVFFRRRVLGRTP